MNTPAQHTTGILIAARYLAYACQGPTRVVIYVHDTRQPNTELWENKYPGQFELDITDLGQFHTILAPTHAQLVEHGWEPMLGALMDPTRTRGWREHTYAWCMPVEPMDPIRKVRDIAGRTVHRGPMSQDRHAALTAAARRQPLPGSTRDATDARRRPLPGSPR